MRKVYVDVTLKVIVQLEEGVSLDEALEDCEYEITSNVEGADTLDIELTDFKVVDSK